MRVETLLRRRLIIIVAFLLGSFLLVGVGVLVGSRLKSPEDLAALAEPPPPSPVLVEVEQRILVDSAVIRAAVSEVQAEGIDLPTGGGTIVTSVDLDPGSRVMPGDLIVSVEGRPRIALTGGFPFYRDLARRDEGPDVAQLERNLVTLGLLHEADDHFDRATQRAVAALYESIGYDPPGGVWWRTTVDMDELVVFPDLPLRIQSVSFTVGDDLAQAPSPHLVIAPEELVLVATVDDPSILAALTPGRRLTAIDDVQGRRFEVQVAAVAPDGASSTVTFAILGESPDPSFERSLRIDVPITDSGGPVLAVPVTALFTAPDGSTLVSTPRGDVRVKVGLIVDGWAEVEAVDGDLSPGDLVSVGTYDAG